MSMKRNDFFPYDDSDSEVETKGETMPFAVENMEASTTMITSPDETLYSDENLEMEVECKTEEADKKEASDVDCKVGKSLEDDDDVVMITDDRHSDGESGGSCGEDEDRTFATTGGTRDWSSPEIPTTTTTPTKRKQGQRPQLEETTKISLHREEFHLLRILSKAGSLPMGIEPLDHDGDSGLVRYRTAGDGPPENEVKVAVYELMGPWDSRIVKVDRDKLEFLNKSKSGLELLERYEKSGLTFRSAEGREGLGVACLVDGKLHGVATVSGGIEAIERIIEGEIEKVSIDLEADRLDLLESPRWDELKSGEEGRRLLIRCRRRDDDDKKKMVIVGCPELVKGFRVKAEKFFEENSKTSIKISDPREVVIKFLKLHCRDLFSESKEMPKATFGQNHVELSGMLFQVKVLEGAIAKAIGSLEVQNFDVAKPGLSATLFTQTDSSTKRLLEEVESLNKCAIWVTEKAKPSPGKSSWLTGLNTFIRSKIPGYSSSAEKVDNLSSVVDRKEPRTPDITVHSGCITSSLDCQVLVNTLVTRRSNQLKDCGAISRAFLLAGGDKLQWDFGKLDQPQKFGSDLAVTKGAAGRLKCETVFHVYVSKQRNRHSVSMMKSTIALCLEEAKSMGYTSIAFPTIGCGRLGYSVQDICDCFKEALEEFKAYHDTQMKVNIFAKDQGAYIEFQKYFSLDSSPGLKTTYETTKPMSEKIKCTYAEKPLEKVVTFTVCLHSKEKEKDTFNKIKHSIEDKLKNISKEKEITHDMIANFDTLSPQCHAKLDAIGLEKFFIKLNKEAKTITVAGLSADIKVIKKKMEHILNEEKELQKNPAFLKSSIGVKAYLEFYARSEEILFPIHWVKYRTVSYGKDQPVIKTPLDKNGNIYKAICDLINKTWDATKAGGLGNDALNLTHKNIEVKNIFVIENPRLFLNYWNNRKTFCYNASLSNFKLDGIKGQGESDIITKDISKHLDELLIPEINECYLFHGSKPDKIDHIIQHGIDNRLCSDRAMFGKGAYFAESSTKADQYTDPKSNRAAPGTIMKMFLAKVSLGSSYLCKVPFPYSRPPCDDKSCGGQLCNDSSHKLLDSIVGLYRNNGQRLLFREFVVYKSDQSYPEFLIEYLRK